MLFGGGTQALFELKVFLVVAIFVYAFFKFTWAIRQFNYFAFAAVIGSAPQTGSPAPDRAFARRMAQILSHGFWHFNAGVRADYFALAALGWFIHSLLFIGATAVITLVLIRRQLFSTTAHDIAEHAEILAAESVASRLPAGEMNSDEPGRSGRG